LCLPSPYPDTHSGTALARIGHRRFRTVATPPRPMSESHSSEEEPIVVAPVEPLAEAVQAAETSKRIAWAVLLLATAYAIQAAAGFVLSIVLAALFALLLAPIVKGLHRIGIPQPLGAAIVML